MDAMEDMVDTSDVEEKEIMEAQKPGYYDKVWGVPAFPGGQNVDMDTNDTESYKMPFARLPPRAPSHKLQAAVNLDPSPNINRLQISMDIQSLDIHSSMPVTTPVLSTSHPRSQAIWHPPESPSSPDLGGFETEMSQPRIKLRLLDPLTGPELPLFADIVNHDRLLGSADPQRGLCPLSPLTPSPSTQPSPSRIPSSTSNLSPLPTSPSIISANPEPHPRKYALRHRSAKQLNPFEYDKRQYKRQLRNMPEAIVMGSNLGGGRPERKERYLEDCENDWEQGEGDPDLDVDADDEWRARERKRERRLEREALDAKMREFGINLESSEESEILMDIGGADSQHGNGEIMGGKKRKRTPVVHRFPMVTELENTQSLPLTRPSTSPVVPAPKLRPRPRPNYHGPSHSPPPSVRAALVVTLDAQVDDDRSFGDNNGDDPWLIQVQKDKPNLAMRRDKNLRNSPIRVDNSEDDITPSSRKGRPKRHLDDESDVQILEDEGAESDEAIKVFRDSDDVEMTGKARKQLKALRRMMPAALRNKLLAHQEDNAKPRAKECTGRQDSDEEGIPLQPGRGRKRIVSLSSRDPKRYEIKGDTESESESSDHPHTSSGEVSIVDDDGGGEEDAERALEESEDGLDAEDIQAWLAPELQGDAVSPETSRRRRPESERDRPRGGDLIDRMLQRTRRFVPRMPQTASNRKPEARRPRNSMIDVITSEARRLGASGGRQTKLAFPKAEGRRRSSAANRQELSPSVVVPSKRGNQGRRAEAQDEKKKSKKNKLGLVQSNLLIVHRDGHIITSGRPRQIINIDDDDDAFHEALAPAESDNQLRSFQRHKAKIRSSLADNIHDKFRRGADIEPDVFDMDMNSAGQRHSKISLDFDMAFLPSGIMLGSDCYIRKGRLYDFISVLKGDKNSPLPFSVTIFGLQIDPDIPISQISPTLASACDKLYDASTIAATDPELPMTVKAADALMHSLCQLVTFRTLHINEEEESLLVTVVAEQINHLVTRINERVELISADGHSMDYRSFMMYWFAVEIHLRLAYAHKERPRMENCISTMMHAAEHYCVQLMCRLLEYGLDRTIGLLQDGQLLGTTSDFRALEIWICIFYIAPFLTGLPVNGTSKSAPPFWRIVEAAMDAQSNKPNSQLYESERIWRTMFSLCAVSQFSLEGLSTSTAKLEAYWPMVKKALKCIRLSADVRDNSKPASTIHKRDTYLRLVTTRCFLLCTRWNWRLNDAEDMFQELCAIFRSRQFSNLLGEPDDFPTFIRDGKEFFFDVHQTNDTAFGLFLKLIVRAAKDFLKMDGACRLRGAKLVRLLSLAVPVGSTSFTKNTPPTGQGLSMLYNRYSAIFVAIYVDSSAKHIRSRLQQARRYIAFKDADYDSRTAAIRSMMYIAILLRHLGKPLDDILSWASEMADDLISELTFSQARDDDLAQKEKDSLVVLVQLLLGSIRVIINTSTLNQSSDLPPKYPDIALLQAWMSRILSNPIAKDHRTGLEICKCIQSFLVARRTIIPLPPMPMPVAGQHDKQESQDEYGDGDLDLNDPALLAFLADIENRPDENGIADHNASDVLDTFSQPLYSCVCMHLGCKSTTFGGPYYEADQWLECWLGCGSVLVRNKKRVWNYYFQLGESAWKDISDSFRRTHLRLQFMLTVLRLDPNVYKSHGDQVLALWFECVVSPNLTIEHDFTSRLFSIDGLRHVLFLNIPCTANMETGHFAFDVNEFKRLRLPLIEVVLSNVSNALNSGVGQYTPLVETLLRTMQHWIEVINRDVMRRVEYVEFGRKIISAIRKHDALTRHPGLQTLLNWGSSL